MTYNPEHNPGNDLIKDALSYYADLNAARRKWREFMAIGDYDSAWRQCESIYDQLEARLLTQTLSPEECTAKAKKLLNYSNLTRGIRPTDSVRQVDREILDRLVKKSANRIFMSKFTVALDETGSLHYSDTRLRGNPKNTANRKPLVKG